MSATGRASREETAPDRRLVHEVLIVLGLSLGASAVYATISLLAKITAPGGLSNQTATLNPSASPRPWLDLTYQLVGIGVSIVPVLLALYLLNSYPGDALRLIGLRFGGRPDAVRDLATGAALAGLIGIPGIGLYYLARALGINASVVPSGLDDYWWTLPVLLLSAVQNAVLEEVVVVGYLMTRLRRLGWSPHATLAASALLRGSYHLYQGLGAFVGNAVMGTVFGAYFQRRGRVMPLVVAHALIDCVAFIGYALLKDTLDLA